MNKLFWKATAVRAIRTVCQTLASTIPAGMVITPALVQSLNWDMVYIVMAWIGTGLLAGVTSMLTSIATGLPEVDYEQSLYQYYDEPADSEVEDEDE